MSRYTQAQPMRVALAGFGNVGQELARRLTRGAIPEVRLTAVAARDLDKARANSAGVEPHHPLVVPVAELPRHADVIVECATAAALPEIARVALDAGKILVPVSVGGLAAHPEILGWVEHGGRIRVATGALPGLDAIRTAAEDQIKAVRLTSRIRPESLAHEAYVRQRGFDFEAPLAEAVQVFAGSAREAALAFPRHFNVAVTVSLAGIGLDRTRVTMFADPEIAGTVHLIEVVGDNLELRLESRNRPSATNPRTSRAVAPSILAALRAQVSPVQIGS